MNCAGTSFSGKFEEVDVERFRVSTGTNEVNRPTGLEGRTQKPNSLQCVPQKTLMLCQNEHNLKLTLNRQ